MHKPNFFKKLNITKALKYFAVRLTPGAFHSHCKTQWSHVRPGGNCALIKK